MSVRVPAGIVVGLGALSLVVAAGFCLTGSEDIDAAGGSTTAAAAVVPGVAAAEIPVAEGARDTASAAEATAVDARPTDAEEAARHERVIEALRRQTRDARGDEIPRPPPEYRGDDLRWRIKYPMEPEEFDALLATLRRYSPDVRTDILQKIRRAKDPALGRHLMHRLPDVPRNPVTVFDYASALIEVAAVTPPEGGRDAVGFPFPDRRAETAAALELLVRKVAEYAPVMNEQEWGGIDRKLARLREVDDGLFDTEAGRSGLSRIRGGLHAQLLRAVDPAGSYLCGLDGLRLARSIADEETHDVMVRLLERWDATRKRFPASEMRPDLTALHLVCRVLLDPPCPAHADAAADALVREFPREPAGRGRARMEEFLHATATDRDTPEGIGARLGALIGIEIQVGKE